MPSLCDELVEIHFDTNYVSRVPLRELARNTGRSTDDVLRDLSQAERKGYLRRRPDGGFDATLPGEAA